MTQPICPLVALAAQKGEMYVQLDAQTYADIKAEVTKPVITSPQGIRALFPWMKHGK